METEAIRKLIAACETLESTISGVLADEGLEDKAAIDEARAELSALEARIAELKSLAIHSDDEGTSYYYRDRCQALEAENAALRGFAEFVSLSPTPSDPVARLETLVAHARLALASSPSGKVLVDREKLRERDEHIRCAIQAAESLLTEAANGRAISAEEARSACGKLRGLVSLAALLGMSQLAVGDF